MPRIVNVGTHLERELTASEFIRIRENEDRQWQEETGDGRRSRRWVRRVRGLYEFQDKRCAICKRKFPVARLNLDHDHKTREIRGLLCNSCNTRLAFFEGKYHEAALAYVSCPPAFLYSEKRYKYPATDVVLGSTT